MRIATWVKGLNGVASQVLVRGFITSQNRQTKEVERLHAKIGQLLMERDYVAEAWQRGKAVLSGMQALGEAIGLGDTILAW